MKMLIALMLWCVSLVLYWPLALLALLLWPDVWLLSLPSDPMARRNRSSQDSILLPI